VTLTDCPPGPANQCVQQLYLLPVHQEDSAYGTAKGSLEIHAQLLGPDGVFQSVAVLHIRMNIDSASDYGTSPRPIDFLMATQSVQEPTMLAPDIVGGDKTASLSNEQTMCVAMGIPSAGEGIDLKLFTLVLCSSATVDLSTSNGCRTENVADMKTYTLFEKQETEDASNTGVQTELSYCFQLPKIAQAAHVLDIGYATAMSVVPVAGSSSDVVQLVRKRSMYDNNVVTTQNFWVDCPSGTHWDDDCECCVINNGSTSDIDAWGIFLLVLLGLALIATVFCFWWWGTPGCSYAADAEYMHPYFVPVVVPDPNHKGKYVHGFRDAYTGTIITEVVVDKHGARAPHHRHRHSKKTKPKPTGQ